MAPHSEVEVTVSSAKDLKNVNWRHGSLKPYAVVWVDSNIKCSTRVDDEGKKSPQWDETLVIPLPPAPIEDHTLHIDIVHAGSEEDPKLLIGSAKLNLSDVLDEVGIGECATRTLKLKRPSGRKQGKLDVKVTIRPPPYREPKAYNAPPPSAPPPSEYPYSAPPPPEPYEQPSYEHEQQQQHPVKEKKKKKSLFGGMGAGLAVGAVAGVLGGLALAKDGSSSSSSSSSDNEHEQEDVIGLVNDGDF